jgi:dipeptidase E
MATLFLTSTGLTSNPVREAFLREVGPDRTKHIVIVPTAASDGKDNKYAKLAEQQLRNSGFEHISFLDIATEPIDMLATADIIYVTGGNTFTLLHAVRTSGADTILLARLTSPRIIYIGVSAGSILLTPTVRLAAEVEPDVNEPNITDFKGLSVFASEIYPHYTKNIESELSAYEHKYDVEVVRINNDQALLVKGDIISRIG